MAYLNTLNVKLVRGSVLYVQATSEIDDDRLGRRLKSELVNDNPVRQETRWGHHA